MHLRLHHQGPSLQIALLCLAACSKGQVPSVSPDEIARAKRVYSACVEDELGLELEQLEISTGNILVKFAQGTSDEAMALARSICEPRIGFALEPGGASVLGPPANLGRPASDKELQKLISSRVKLGFEGAVLVEAGGQRRIEAGFGKLRGKTSRAPDAQTAFDCGSIMKDVTAAVIFLLEEQGALSREQTLGELFAHVPDVWRAVSVSQVLAHSAGFQEYHDTEGDFEAMDREQALAAIFAQTPLFAPGTDSAYSNSGYTVLAALIEQITEADYRDVVRERVFAPLAMDRSGFYGDPLWRDGNVAVGRGAERFAGNDPTLWPEPTWALIGNGGLVSTAEDLLRLAKAFDGDRLFQPDTRAAFAALQSTGSSIAAKPLLGYAGGNDYGFDVVVGEVPDDSTYVIVASHVRSAINAEILGLELLQAVYGEVAVLPDDD